MLDLNKLIGKTKKHFIESTLDAEFDKHMGYQKHDQNSRMFLTIIEKEKLRKQSHPIMKNWYSSSKRTTINIWTKDC